jgi:hypothetical protein
MTAPAHVWQLEVVRLADAMPHAAVEGEGYERTSWGCRAARPLGARPQRALAPCQPRQQRITTARPPSPTPAPTGPFDLGLPDDLPFLLSMRHAPLPYALAEVHETAALLGVPPVTGADAISSRRLAAPPYGPARTPMVT